MRFEKKDYIIDPNSGEKLEIKSELGKLEKEIAPGLRKTISIASAMLASTLSFSQPIDTSSLPHYAKLDDWLKKHVKISVHKVKPNSVDDYLDTYNADYYERYNKNASRLEYSRYRAKLPFEPIGGKMKFYAINYSLVETKNIRFSQQFLKENNLDKIPVNINGKTYITKAKFKELDFEATGKKGHLVYGMGKKIILVYISYLDKIQVLGSVIDGEFYEEDKYIEYSISTRKEAYKKELSAIFKLLGCSARDCNIRKDMEGNRYFYNRGKLVGKVEQFGNKKIVIKNNIVVGKIFKQGNKFLLIDNAGRIISEFPGYKRLNINLKQIDANLIFYLK